MLPDLTDAAPRQSRSDVGPGWPLTWGAWLDRYDERRAALDELHKAAGSIEIGADLAFPGASTDADLRELGRLSMEACASSSTYFSCAPATSFRIVDGALSFKSAISTETSRNDIVQARVFLGRNRRNAVVILPHWNADTGAYASFAGHLVRLGLTVVELTLPYHGLRNRDGAVTSDYFLSANLGRTIRSVRQSVLDARGILDWLSDNGYEHIGLIGLSLGSCIAGLVAEHDCRVSSAALLLTAGDFAEVVWTGRATRLISRELAPHLSIEELRAAWAIISTATFVPAMARDDLATLVISGNRDGVVKPYLTARFIDQLRHVDANVTWRRLGCGHYSLKTLPFNIICFLQLLRFLRQCKLL